MIENQIVKGILQDFCKTYAIDYKETKSFEYLVNFIILSEFNYTKQIDADLLGCLDVDTNNANFGLDSIQIYINDNIVYSPDDVTTYMKSGIIHVNIVFIQSKTSAKIDVGDVLKTIKAVKMFLGNDNNYIHNNTNIENAYNIYKKLFEFEFSQHFDDSSPTAFIFFVTEANSINENNKKLGEDELDDIGVLFPDIKKFYFRLYGSNDIINMYKEAVNAVSTQFSFKNKLELDSIGGVKASYLGYISGKDLIKLLKDPRDAMRKWIFYDNVRDFQGFDNSVNKEIGLTIRNQEKSDKFILYNNGITIIARSIKALGANNYTIKDYQIVNGCQTCNVVFKYKDKADNINIPLKLIITEDAEITDSIVKANNRQTPVPDEQFLALDRFHKHLQDLYLSYSRNMPVKIFYERRSGEARSNENLSGYKIVSLHSIVRCITACAYQSAYIVYNNNPANILKNRSDKLFKRDHIGEIYFISNYILELFKIYCTSPNTKCDKFIKYYIIMIVFIILYKSTHIDFFSRESQRKAVNIIKNLRKNDISDIMEDAIALYNSVIKKYGSKNDHKTLRSSLFNKSVIDEVKNRYSI